MRTNIGSASSIVANGKAGDPWIVEGIPRPIGETTDFSMFIFIPISTGKVTTMMPIPIYEQYEVYDLEDDNVPDGLRVAHVRGKDSLPQEPTRIGGVLKAFSSDGRKTEDGLYLEATHYTPTRRT